MGVYLGLFCFVIISLLAISQCSVYVYVNYIKKLSKDNFILEVRLFDLIKIYRITTTDTIDLIINELLLKLNNPRSTTNQIRDEYNREKKTVQRDRNLNYFKILINKFICRKLYCQMKIGTEYADETAILYGIVHFFKSIIVRYLYAKMPFAKRPEISIIPDFHTRKNEVEFQCILSTKLGNVIYILKSLI